MTDIARHPLMTAEELFLIPSDDFKYELVDGLLVRMPPTGGLHGAITARILRILDEYVQRHALGVVCGGDCGFILRRNPDIVRAPDAAFVARSRVPSTGVPESFWALAPDLAVEVLSPTDRAGERHAKIADYLTAGTRLVWIVDPRRRTVVVYRPAAPPVILEQSDSLDGGAVLPGFSCPVAQLFD